MYNHVEKDMLNKSRLILINMSLLNFIITIMYCQIVGYSQIEALDRPTSISRASNLTVQFDKTLLFMGLGYSEGLIVDLNSQIGNFFLSSEK